MGNQFSEDLFRSIDTIVSARVRGLPYDQTLIGYISDVSDRKKGMYKAKHDNLEITAYSDNTEYELGDQVYISVPKADYSQKKIIIGRMPQEEIVSAKVRPFENYVSCTKNFNPIDKEYNLLVNGAEKNKLIGSYSFESNRDIDYNAGYELMGFQVSLSTALENNNYTVASGNYYFQIVVNAFNQSKTKDTYSSNKCERFEYYLNIEDMINISPYNTYGYCRQEKLFNIKDLVIKDLAIYLCQDGDFQTELGESVPEISSFVISCKDISVTFGYSGRKENFIKGQPYLYTIDGLLYNANDDNEKKVYSRVIIYKNNQIENLNPPIDYTFFKWYKYNPTVIQVDPILNSIAYEPIENIDTYDYEINVRSIATAQIQQYKIALSLDNYDWIISEPLVFKNNIDFSNSEIIDAISGFQVSSIDSNEGVFNIYGQDNLLLNEAEGFRNHHLLVSYYATSSNRRLRAGDIIKWSIPTSKTMLLPAKNIYGDEIKEVVLTEDDLKPDGMYRLPFKIKTLYTPTFTQNTIKCELTLVEDTGFNTVLNYNKELFFGTAGSSGNDYIFILELQDKDTGEKVAAIMEGSEAECNNRYAIVPKLYDYNMNEIIINSNDYPVEYKLFNGETASSFSFAGVSDVKPGLRVIEAAIPTLGITTYLPIATKTSEQCDYFEGCRTITYDITGKKPVYYKVKNLLYKENNIVQDQTWALCQWDGEKENLIENNSQLPVLIDGVIVPPSVFPGFIKGIYLKCSIGGNSVWYQPILITKNKYPSAMWNEELNQLQIGEWKIKTNMVGQFDGKSGIVLGELISNTSSKTGLFGFKDGVEEFALPLTPDKSVYFKYAKGRIEQSDLADEAYLAIQANLSKALGKDSETYNVGTEKEPVYFKDGKPVVCSPLTANDIAYTETISIADQFKNISDTIISLTKAIETMKSTIQSLEEEIDKLQ